MYGMTTIEQALKRKEEHASLLTNLDRALNIGEAYPKSRFDKSCFRLSISDTCKVERPWYSAFVLNFGYGTYGDSSFYGSNSKYSDEYFVRAVNSLCMQIVEKMKELSKQDYEKAMKEAKEEAEKILKEIETIVTL